MLLDSTDALLFHEDMTRISDRLPTPEEYWRVRHLILQRANPAVTDEALARILEGCTALEVVDLSGVPDTTDRSIVLLAARAAKLEGINLSGCTQVTDVGVMELTTKSLPLQWIHLNGVVGLTDPSISAIARTCFRLLDLELCDLPLLTPSAVRDIWSYSR